MTTHTDKWYYGILPVYVPEVHTMDASSIANRYRYDIEVHVMARGPRIRGHVVVWPSLENWGGLDGTELRNKLKDLGFRWVPTYREWRRDSRRSHQGKTHTAAQWLASCRKLWAQTWDTYELSDQDDGVDSIEGAPEHYYNETGDQKRNAKFWELRQKARAGRFDGSSVLYGDILDGLLKNWVTFVPVPVLGDLEEVRVDAGHLTPGHGLEVFQKSIRLYQVTPTQALAITHRRHTKMVEAKADGRLALDDKGQTVYTETAEEKTRRDRMAAESRNRLRQTAKAGRLTTATEGTP